MHSIYQFLHDSWVGDWVHSVPDLFAICESIHFVGLSLLLGALLVVDLRVLGLFRNVTYASVLNLVWVAIVGFALTLASGVVFLANTPALYEGNPAFNLKLILLATAGVNALVFEILFHRRLAMLPLSEAAPWMMRVPALISITIWMVVILCGRLMPTFAAVGGG